MATRKLALVGTGEFTPAMDDIDAYLLSLLDAEHLPRRVAILPTAVGQEAGFADWVHTAEEHFQKLGAEPVGVPVLEETDTARTEWLDQVRSASLIYYSSGHPGRLCSTLTCATLPGTPLWDLVLAQYRSGRVVAGSSAGAMIMGRYVLTNAGNILEGQSPIYQQGLGLVDYTIFPRYSTGWEEDYSLFGQIIDRIPPEAGRRILGIEEETALVLLDERKARVMGKSAVHVMVGGSERVYQSGESFTLPE